jgi:ketosteroid isomerase-like protein
MTTRSIIAEYYRLANSGDWSSWTDLFSAQQIMDEQLAGHIEGKQTLQEMMADFPKMYATFKNVPTRVIIEGDEAAVFSHISAETAAGEHVEVDVANYFRITDGRISYMRNVHDTLPFQGLLSQ